MYMQQRVAVLKGCGLGCGSCDVEASAVSVRPRLKLGQMHRAPASLYRSLFVTNVGIILRGARSVLSLCVFGNRSYVRRKAMSKTSKARRCTCCCGTRKSWLRWRAT